MAVWIILVIISAMVLVAEAIYIMPDKMPWNRRKKKK